MIFLALWQIYWLHLIFKSTYEEQITNNLVFTMQNILYNFLIYIIIKDFHSSLQVNYLKCDNYFLSIVYTLKGIRKGTVTLILW